MRVGAAFGWAMLGGLVIVACGSSSSDGGSTANACTAGDSKACTGLGGCSGGQVCNASGTAYGDCACGGLTDGGPTNDASSDAALNETSVDSGPPFTSPKSLPGLTLWVNGEDFGDAGTTLLHWPDQSGLGNDLKNNSFTPQAATIQANAIGGLPAARFVAAHYNGYELANPAPLLTGTDNFVMAFVANAGAGCGAIPSCGLVYLTDTNGGGISLYDDSNVLTASLSGPAGSDQKTAAISNGPHVIVLRRSSPTMAEIRVDGVATSFPLTAAYSFSGTDDYYLGHQVTLYDGDLDGDVAELVIAKGTTDGDIANLEAYLKSKYGL